MQRNLLGADAANNLVGGVLLLFFREWMGEAPGLPPVTTDVKPNVLGGELVGKG
jgi:hypothetical protein